MALATLIAITLGCIGWSLWIRRVTWSCRWEVAATLNIALQGLAVILMSPFASETLGHWLHALTGMWNLEDYIGNDARVYRSDFFEVPTDFWLALYWLLLCGLLIYLLGYGARALLILRKDPRSRRIANVYLAASASGILACTVWIFACGCGTGFALTSAQSWRIKTKWFTRASR